MNKFVQENYVNVTTSKLTTFLFLFFFIFVPYLLVFLLLGEVNLLKLNWLKIATENSSYIFNLNIMYIMFGIIAASILLFIIFKYLFKKVNLDLIPFICITHTICITTITSGLIPYNQSNFVYIIIARFVLVIVLALIIFFISNSISNFFMLKSPSSYDYYQKFIEEEKKQKEIVKSADKFKNKDEKDYIEVEKD